jgi:hypothetical protein
MYEVDRDSNPRAQRWQALDRALRQVFMTSYNWTVRAEETNLSLSYLFPEDIVRWGDTGHSTLHACVFSNQGCLVAGYGGDGLCLHREGWKSQEEAGLIKMDLIQ